MNYNKKTKTELYAMAIQRGIKGRSQMNKKELVDALRLKGKKLIKKGRGMKGGVPPNFEDVYSALLTLRNDFITTQKTLLEREDEAERLSKVLHVEAQEKFRGIVYPVGFAIRRMLESSVVDNIDFQYNLIVYAHLSTNKKWKEELERFINQNISNINYYRFWTNGFRTKMNREFVEAIKKNLGNFEEYEDPDYRFIGSLYLKKTGKMLSDILLKKTYTMEGILTYSYFYEFIKMKRDEYNIP